MAVAVGAAGDSGGGAAHREGLASRPRLDALALLPLLDSLHRVLVLDRPLEVAVGVDDGQTFLLDPFH